MSKIKIRCTRAEQIFLIEACKSFCEEHIGVCVLGKRYWICFGPKSCQKCLSENIEWEITDEQKEK